MQQSGLNLDANLVATSATDVKASIGGWRTHDPLLACLIEISRIHGRGMTPEALLLGLPLTEGKLGPGVFRRAAARAGLASRISRRAIGTIKDELLPAILLLEGNDACVLLGWNADRTKAKVLFSESGQGATEIAADRLNKTYAGHCIFARPRFKFDERSPEIRQTVERHWFWGVIAENKPLYKDVLLAALLINLAGVVIPFFTLNVYDRVVPNNATETLWSLAVGVGVLVVFDYILRVSRSTILDVASKRIDIELSARIMERVLGMKLANRPASAGSFAANLRTFESVRDFITSATITAFIDLPFALIYLALIFWLGWPMGLVIVVAVVGLVLYALLQQPKMQALTDSMQRALATRNSTLIESLVGLETLKAQCAEGLMQARWEGSVSFLARVGSELRDITARIVTSSMTVQQAVTVINVIVGVYLIAEKQLTMGGMIAVTMLASRALAPFAQIAGLLMQYQNTVMGLAGLDKLMTQPVERPDSANFVRRERLTGEIEFDRVSFSYPGAPKEALREVSFKIKPGEHVAIIGKVGSGKSTLNRLILGLYQPSSGSIKLDGVDIRQLDPAEVRRSVGYVPQDVTLFYGSLRENITLGMPNAEDYSILQAAEMAGLDELVSNHPAGFDMPIGERGESLSGGQRQQVAIARALVHEPPMMLLDEPSSAMDSSTEDALKQRLSRYLKGRTMILVTHRTSLMDIVDRLIVIDQGRVMANGPKETVIEALRTGKVGRG